MRRLSRLGGAWGEKMQAADRVRIMLAWGFVFGAVSHVGWVIYHGDVWHHGPAPAWAPWFWYALCIVDVAVFWMMLTRPRIGLLMALATMAATLAVNWTQFPTFEFGFNYVLIGLTLFGLIVWATAPWLWRASRWRLNPTSSAHSGG